MKVVWLQFITCKKADDAFLNLILRFLFSISKTLLKLEDNYSSIY